MAASTVGIANGAVVEDGVLPVGRIAVTQCACALIMIDGTKMTVGAILITDNAMVKVEHKPICDADVARAA